jgi:ATP-dependent exoDNAse (exonuclease V) beta subunit
MAKKKAARASKGSSSHAGSASSGGAPASAVGAAGPLPFEYMRGGAGTRKTSLLCKTALDYLVGTAAHPSTLVLTTYSREAAGQLLDRLRSLVLRDRSLTWATKRDILKRLDAATISTNHALGRAAVEHHWLERSDTPAAVVVGNATRAELIGTAIDTARRLGLTTRQRRAFDTLIARLGRGEAERRKMFSSAGHVGDDIRQLIDMVGPSGMDYATFVAACEAEIDVLCTALASERARRGVTETVRTLRRACRRAARQIRPLPSVAKGATRHALEAMEGFLASKAWHALHELTKIKGVTRPGPPSEPFVERVRLIAQDYLFFPELIQDLKEYVRCIAHLAHRSYHEYQRLLTQTGRIDFAEMEQAFNKLLDDPAIRGSFCAKYGFVGIDEAQDMTAASAGAFGKVTETVKRGAWIADPNQSIYGFRGADYRAVQAEARRLVAALTGQENTQSENNRSSPGVIRFVNDLFETLVPAGACPARPLPTSHVQDAPVAHPAKPNGRIERWVLKGQDEETRFAEVAEGVQRLRTAGPTSPNDEEICILVRTQDAKHGMAAALAARGIPVAVRSAEVAKSREGLVIISALRLLGNHQDRHAEAVLRFLLDDRASPGADNPEFDRWLSDTMTIAPGVTMTPAIAALLDVRDRGLLPTLAPATAVLVAIESTGLIGRLAAWGDCIERQSRIDTMLSLARAYEKREAAAGRLATVAGFVVELERERPKTEKEEPESEPPPKDMPGVRVMTLHASKGLGFKVTIAVALKLSSRVERPHGVRLVNNRPCPLPWPLKDRENPDLDTIMSQLPANRHRVQEALADETQLLYVGLTRSKHTLIIAHPDEPKENSWLSAIFGASDPAAGSPAGIDHFLPQTTAATQVVHPLPPPSPPSPGAKLPAADYVYVDNLATVTSGPAAVGVANTVQAIASHPPRRLSDVAHAPRYRSPSGNRTTSCVWNQAGVPVNVPLPAGVPQDLVNGAVKKAAGAAADALGDAIHSFMAAIPSLPPLDPSDPAIRVLWDRVAGRCLQSFLDPTVVTPLAAAGITASVLVERGQAFVDWCQATFGVTPVDWTVEAGTVGPAASGGNWRGRIDLVFEARAGAHAGRTVLIDHKAVLTQSDRCAVKAAEYFGEVSAYAEALGSVALARSPDGIYLHFPLAGVVVPLISK